MKRPLGVILYRGRSPFADGQYVVIALLSESANDKTGGMIQTHIIVDGTAPPTETVKDGSDAIVCGDCALKGLLSQLGRACYVNLGQGPRMVHLSYMAGRYDEYDPAIHDQFFKGRSIRWGSYGDPVLIPIDTVRHICGLVDRWTGYTHQYMKPEFAAYREFFMASVHDQRTVDHARYLGWRFFLSTLDATPIEGTFVCPASEEAGYAKTCIECCACDGHGPNGTPQRHSVRLQIHGGFGVMAAAKKTPALTHA